MIKNCEVVADNLPSAEEMTTKDKDLCPVKWAADVARNAHAGTCGKGTFCRDGLMQLHLFIQEVADFKGSADDLELVESLLNTMLVAADCHLSYTAAQLMKTSLDTHRDDWTAHVLRKRCLTVPLVAPAVVAEGEGGMRRRRRGGGA